MKTREIERKYVVQTPKTLATVESQLGRNLKISSRNCGQDTDTYYTLSGVDFVRRRSDSQGGVTLTAKVTDQGTTENRWEVSIPFTQSINGYEFLECLFGNPRGIIHKTYTNYEMHDGTIISVYKVDGDKRIFLEIESPSLQLVENYEAFLLSKRIKMVREMRSNYEIFITKESK